MEKPTKNANTRYTHLFSFIIDPYEDIAIFYFTWNIR